MDGQGSLIAQATLLVNGALDNAKWRSASPASPRSGTTTPGGSSPRSPRSGRRRKSWRASCGFKGSTKYPIYMDVVLDGTDGRAAATFQKQTIKKVRNLCFDEVRGLFAVTKELKFRNRWYGQDRVDEPTAQPVSDILHFRAVALDMANLYQAFPGRAKIIRLRKPMPPGCYTEERNVWQHQLAMNQGEYLKGIITGGFPDIKPNDIQVEVQYASGDAPAGGFFFHVPVEDYKQKSNTEEEGFRNKVHQITLRRGVAFDFNTGRAVFARGFNWEPRTFSAGAGSDAPNAQLIDEMAHDSAFRDMAELWHVFGAPAKIVTEAPHPGVDDAAAEEWCQTLARNRAAFVKEVLHYYEVPEDKLVSGIFGDMNIHAARVGNRFSVDAACTPTGANGVSKMDRLRVRSNLHKAVGVNRIADIPMLEEALSEARALHMEEQWTRVDPLMSDAEKALRVLYQKRRRQEARSRVLDRKEALARIKVSQATKMTMIEAGELRMEGDEKPRSPRQMLW